MSIHTTLPVPVVDLIAMLRDGHARTRALVAELDGDQLMGPRLAIVNPLLWEIGHVAWFHEFFVLRGLDRRESLIDDADALYDSMKVAHDTRWDLPLPDVDTTIAYMERVLEAMAERLGGNGAAASVRDSYYTRLTVHHEDMHDEAFTWTRQTLAYPPPDFGHASTVEVAAGPLPGDVEIPGGRHVLGATGTEPFIFDNEKWGHAVEVAPFRIARAPVTNADYAAFVEDGGYAEERWWDADGRAWRQGAGAEHPVYWRRDVAGWLVRGFDDWRPMRPHAAVIHVCWHEANAYCRWTGRRLPTEVEWEFAASRAPGGAPGGAGKRRFPWGDAPPTPALANLDGRAMGVVDVAAFPDGDTPFGCRQMIGNVWEWTATDFAPYPGFSADPYKDYSRPWFYDHKVSRGGSWATRDRLAWNTWRNFAMPHRRDLFYGFRTCAA